ncbi:MAG: CoA ester lyase [Nitriliruptoraceae bacterium]|nr:CoA ester lyase [Nitriliruptoraceae bacterium]
MSDTETLRPRRSVLYLPGANERALVKARDLPCDGLILDLEDAVAPDAKPDARARVAEAVAERGFGHREVAIRVNGLDTPWFDDDVRAAAAAGPDVVLVPKVSSVGDVARIEAALEAADAPSTTVAWAMLETPHAVLRAEAIAAASPRLTGFVLGTNDLVKELDAAHVPGRAPVLPSLAWCLLAVRAAGKVALDGVFNDLDDAEGFAAECRQGREMGFDGKTLIHPKQLEACNRIFAPSEEALVEARTVIEAFDAAGAAGQGVVTVGGRMIEQLHVDQAQRVLAVQAAIDARTEQD